MRALCVKPDRQLELREISAPAEPPAGHLVVQLEASAINPGDKAFLARPNLLALPGQNHDVWGASGAGRVVGVGEGAPQAYLGRQVAMYRSISRSPQTLGLWSEKVVILPSACVRLPDEVRARDYSGSLVNAITAYAFLEQARDEGHEGVVVTAGNSATGRAVLALTRARATPTLFLVRSTSARDALLQLGAEHVLVTNAENFDHEFATLAARIRATAIFDGVGGALATRLAPLAALNTTFYFYGFLGGSAPVSAPTVVFMSKNLTMKRFGNFESPTVKDPRRLTAALQALEAVIADPLFQTSIGQEFRFDRIDEAIRYESAAGAKAILVP